MSVDVYVGTLTGFRTSRDELRAAEPRYARRDVGPRLIALAAALTAVAPALACRRQSVAAAADATPRPVAPAVDAAARREPDRLPEDPVLAAKATAQWREHLVKEERERKLRYDRDRMKEHRAVVRFLVATRARYDRATSKAAVTAIKARLPAAIAPVRQRITRIDHWGTNSNLLADYDAMLNALAESYPAARIGALGGDPSALAALRAELDMRTKKIEDWLAQAAETEDE